MSWKLKFSCGCVFPKEACTRARVHRVWHYICPKHPTEGVMIKRITTCGICLEEFEFGKQGQIPENCNKCSKRRKQKAPDRVSLIPMNNPNIMGSQKRSDCKYRISECLLKYTNRRVLPCKTCTRYIPKEDKPTIFAYRER